MKKRAGWATLASGALNAFEQSGGDIGFSAFVDQHSKRLGVNSSTLWRHVAAYKFWSVLRQQGSFGELPTAEEIQTLVSSVYLMGLAQFAQGNPRSAVQKFVHAIRDGQPFDAALFLGAGRPLMRGRGASAKNIERIQSQPQFDLASLAQAMMERLPAWAALGLPPDVSGHVYAEALGRMPEGLGNPDAIFFLINDAEQDEEAELIRLGSVTLISPGANLTDQLQHLEEAKRSLRIGQSWLGMAESPRAEMRELAAMSGVGLLLHEMVSGEQRLTVLLEPKPVEANVYFRELVLSKFLKNPGMLMVNNQPRGPKASGGPALS